MSRKHEQARDSNPMALGRVMIDWTPGATDLPGGVKAVIFNAAGTCDLIDGAGVTHEDFPFAALAELPIVPDRITAMATATKCWLVL